MRTKPRLTCLLSTEHSEAHAGKFGLFYSPAPWGPWTTVAYEKSWGSGHIETSTFHWNFTGKWRSDDGTRFTLIFTGKNTNDPWNTVAGRFLLRAPERDPWPAEPDTASTRPPRNPTSFAPSAAVRLRLLSP